MGGRKKNRRSGQNKVWHTLEEMPCHDSLRSEQYSSHGNSGMESNVPRQQDQSQSMGAVALGRQSGRYDHRARSNGGSHGGHIFRTADSYHDTREAAEHHGISGVGQLLMFEPRNFDERKSLGRNLSQDSYLQKDGYKRDEYNGDHSAVDYYYSQEENCHGKRYTLAMSCSVCLLEYNAEDCKPRNLKCGHCLCSSCVQQLIQNSNISCPECRVRTYQVKFPEDFPVNYSLLQLLEDFSSKTLRKREKSPHGSKCMEAGALIEYHCASCKLWVCAECNRIEHKWDTCISSPFGEALQMIAQDKESKAKNACQMLEKSVREAKDYGDVLENCLVILETTLDRMKKEHKRLRKIPEDSKRVEAELQSSVAEISKARDLKEALSVFKKFDESVISANEWASSVTSSRRSNRVNKLSKELLCTTVELQAASVEKREILAMHTLNNKQRFSKLVCEGGRIHMFSLVQTAPPSGSHALPLECIKTCIDSTSALTFLDLSWGGESRGRVYIRLNGDSIRGRQFLILCTGEEGPTLRNTPFHRLWWKGRPGEHVWGGDYSHSDGSGGTEVKKIDANETPPEAGHKLPITAGLVAGRYEKTNISSIFRIFTKDAKDVEVDSAFGQVEFGLQFISESINHCSIQDVIISDCGIVIEL